MTAPLSGESWGLSEPREPHLLPAVLGLEAQRVRACVCACMRVPVPACTACKRAQARTRGFVHVLEPAGVT